MGRQVLSTLVRQWPKGRGGKGPRTKRQVRVRRLRRLAELEARDG